MCSATEFALAELVCLQLSLHCSRSSAVAPLQSTHRFSVCAMHCDLITISFPVIILIVS